MISFLSFPAGIAFFHLFRFFPWISALAALSVLSLLSMKRKYGPAFLVALGFVYAFARHAPPAGPGDFYSVAWAEGYFHSPAVKREGGFSQGFSVTQGLNARTMRVLSDREFEVGHPCRLKLKVRIPRGRKNPGSLPGGSPYAVLLEGGVEESRTLKVKSVSLAFNRLRQGMNGSIRAALSPQAASLVMAVTTGQKGEMDHALREDFSRAGLAHILSISGTHFGLFGVLVFAMFRAGIKYLPRGALERITFYLTPSETAAILTLPFMLFYLGVSGAGIPSIRAFIMMALFLVGLLVSRSGYWLRFLFVAAVLLMVWDPAVILDISFQLSFIAVLFIGRVTDPMRYGEAERGGDSMGGGIKRRVSRYLRKSLAITLAASVGVSPLVAYYFHYVSVVSPLTNLVVAPLVGFLLVPLSLLGSLLFLMTGSYALGPVVQPVAKACIWLARGVGSMPFASTSVPHFPLALVVLFYAGVLLWVLLRKKSLLLLSLAPALAYAAIAVTTEKPLSVTFLDVGQADASVVEFPDGKVMVVDTGWRGSEVAGYLRYRGHETIDVLLLTHAHADHTGGALRLMRQFDVQEVWDSGWLAYPGWQEETESSWKSPLKDIRRRVFRRGDVVSGDGYTMSFLHPYEGFYTSEGRKGTGVNNASLVFRLEGGGRSFLMTGDVEEEAVEDILHLGSVLRSDVLKVPHHGLERSYMAFLMRQVSPDVAVLSTESADNGLFNGLNNPRLFATGRDGAVKMEAKNGQLRARPYEEFVITEPGGNLGEELKNVKRLFTVW